jgi:hypothetical protein
VSVYALSRRVQQAATHSSRYHLGQIARKTYVDLVLRFSDLHSARLAAGSLRPWPRGPGLITVAAASAIVSMLLFRATLQRHELAVNTSLDKKAAMIHTPYTQYPICATSHRRPRASIFSERLRALSQAALAAIMPQLLASGC